MIPTNTSSPSLGVIACLVIGVGLVFCTGLYIRKFGGEMWSLTSLAVLILGVAIIFAGVYGTIQQGDYQYNVASYVLATRKYKSERQDAKIDHRNRQHDKRILKRDERRYHSLPSTNFHDPQVGAMSLKQFSKYQAERRTDRQQIKADWNQYESDPTENTAEFLTQRDLDGARYRMASQGRKFFVRHSPLPAHELKHAEHLNTRGVRNLKLDD